MARNVGMGILRMFAVISGVGVLAFVVIGAGTVFMPGTKIGHTFGASAEALAGDEESTPAPPPVATSPDAGTAADAGSSAY